MQFVENQQGIFVAPFFLLDINPILVKIPVQISALWVAFRKDGSGQGGFAHLTRSPDEYHFFLKIIENIWCDIKYMAILTCIPK